MELVKSTSLPNTSNQANLNISGGGGGGGGNSNGATNEETILNSARALKLMTGWLFIEDQS